MTRLRLEETDLRGITREVGSCLTVVSVYTSFGEPSKVRWLVFGEADLRHNEPTNTWMLVAYLRDGATDFEHDSAYALQLPLIGLAMRDLSCHQTTFGAWVDPNDDRLGGGFRVPKPGYDPWALPGSSKCAHRSCWKGGAKGPLIVPEGHYTGPPRDEDLFAAVRGKRVELVVGRPMSPSP